MIIEDLLGLAKHRLHLQLEESIGDLQHQDMRMIVFMADQNPFASPPHPMLLVVLLQPLQPREHGGVFLRLVFFRAECVIAERKEANRLRLVCGEGFGEYRTGINELAGSCKLGTAGDHTGRRFGGLLL